MPVYTGDLAAIVSSHELEDPEVEQPDARRLPSRRDERITVDLIKGVLD